MLEVDIMEGSCLRGEPSTLKANIMEVRMFKARPSTRVVRLGSPGDSDKHTNCMEATAGKQQPAGKRALSRSPAQPVGL